MACLGAFSCLLPVAGLLYVSSRFVRLSETLNKELCFSGYSWAATSLLAVLIWFQSPDWCMPLLWIGLGLALSLVGDTLKRGDLKWQALRWCWSRLVAHSGNSWADHAFPSPDVSFHFRQPDCCGHLSVGSLGAACRDPANLHVGRNSLADRPGISGSANAMDSCGVDKSGAGAGLRSTAME